jgi:hypothetical protein
MNYPVVASYHPFVSADRLVKDAEGFITGNVNDFMTDEEILQSLINSYSLTPVAILGLLCKTHLTIPEGSLWWTEYRD